MHTPLSRRQFARRLLAAGIPWTAAPLLSMVPARGVAPFQRAGTPRLLTGLAAYSFRNFFVDSDHKREKPLPTDRQMDMFRFLDYCADHGCQGAELTSYYFPADVKDEYLLKVKRHAFLRGVAISGTAIGNTFTYPAGEKRQAEIELTRRWIDRAAVLGAPHIRVFAGGLQGASLSEAKKLCIAALEECGEYAGRKGILLGLENHGGIVAEADDTVEILRAVNSPWVGINLDSGNFNTPDPYTDLAKIAPYAVNVQLKLEMHPRGQPKSPADLPRLIKILRDANYQGYVTLEYESAEDPYIAVPKALARIAEAIRAS